MAPIRKGDGTTIAPKGITEVRKGDGTVIWQSDAIRDSEADGKLIHRWVLADDGSGGLDVSDFAGSVDGTNNGVTATSGNWADGIAGDFDGTDDYISTGTLGSFGSNLATDFAVALSFTVSRGSEDFINFMGHRNGSDSTNFELRNWYQEDTLAFLLNDATSDGIVVKTQNTFMSGGTYRVVFNKTSNSAAGMEIWVNQAQETTDTQSDSAFDDPADFENPLTLGAWNDNGAISRYFPGVIDDICIFNDSLTQSEIESYNNPF